LHILQAEKPEIRQFTKSSGWLEMETALKKYYTIGCCGIDCGLCPRFYTDGDSACPGCGGPNFREKHPSCGFLTCCIIKNGLEVCSDCKDYPCIRFDSERKGFDSFVTHRMVFANLELIKTKGIYSFIKEQSVRMEILKDFLANYDDGRSKSFFCISCTLLPINVLQSSKFQAETHSVLLDMKGKNKLLKNALILAAEDLNIDLKLRKKK
jgi:hypothetical protein